MGYPWGSISDDLSGGTNGKSGSLPMSVGNTEYWILSLKKCYVINASSYF